MTLQEYYAWFILNKQVVIDSPFDDPRTKEEREEEVTPYIECSPTCIHPNCPHWDKEHARRLFV